MVKLRLVWRLDLKRMSQTVKVFMGETGVDSHAYKKQRMLFSNEYSTPVHLQGLEVLN